MLSFKDTAFGQIFNFVFGFLVEAEKISKIENFPLKNKYKTVQKFFKAGQRCEECIKLKRAQINIEFVSCFWLFLKI